MNELKIEFLKVKKRYSAFLTELGFSKKGKGLFKRVNEVYLYSDLEINYKSSSDIDLQFSLSFGIITEVSSKLYSQKVKEKISLNNRICLIDGQRMLKRSFYYGLNSDIGLDNKTLTKLMADVVELLRVVESLNSLQKLKEYIFKFNPDSWIECSIIILDLIVQDQAKSDEFELLNKYKLLVNDYWKERFNWLLDNDLKLRNKLGVFRF